jgi:hypothetical protein
MFTELIRHDDGSRAPDIVRTLTKALNDDWGYVA